MDVVWSQGARSDFESILHQLIDVRRPDAYHLCAAIDEHVARLGELPYTGSIGRVTATREFPLPDQPYVVVYTVKPDHVYVLRLLPQA
ncbi:type II toxin-antitoxin system RelE/ParE family toxin [Chthonobacter albigriseus]|uniref:type II toxin-antitoxin system RelE/ParE family toxin n=1 Tax=Chthonobacter albigriseus TaxID=1683161 RepID=UPI0015EEF4D6|nr:type II toxin-antitoxin system RelE/ParE family toxin [Chthonobacter albigriseus]